VIDFIKILVIGINSEVLKQNPLLNFEFKVNSKTGEITSCYQAEFKGVIFKIYESGSVYVSGSLHKYWNNGKHNYNDFDINALNEVLNEIKQLFGIVPEQMIILQLELGVNFIPPRPTPQLLRYCFLHSTKSFKEISVPDEGKYIQAIYNEKIIKLYDKARHYRGKGFNVPYPEIMRFEIHFDTLDIIKKMIGIPTGKGRNLRMEDINQYGLENVVPLLVQEWQKVLFYDSTIQSKSKSLLKFSNLIYWEKLTERNDNGSMLRKQRRELKKLILNHSENLPQQIEDCILQKGLELTKKGNGFDRKNKLVKIRKGNGSDYLNIQSNPSPGENQNKRFCRVTGIDISMQRKGSKMLSVSGLRYYKDSDPELFQKLKRMFLTDYWKNENPEKEIWEIYHNIRNKKNNRKYKQNRIYPENQFRLFQIEPHKNQNE
jgi:hypothetical protein